MISGGEENYKRGFLRVDTGEWGSLGTKAYLADSYEKYDKFKGPGDLEKKQLNAVGPPGLRERELHHPRRSTTTATATRSIAPRARANFAQFGRDYDNLDVLHA